jgi:hypothetical protein
MSAAEVGADKPGLRYTRVKEEALQRAFGNEVSALFNILAASPASKMDVAGQHFAQGFAVLERATRIAAKVMGIKLQS